MKTLFKTRLSLACLLMISLPALGQNLRIEWATMGSEKAMTGNVFRVTGVLGTTDLGPMTNGALFIEEGGHLAMVTTQERLYIARWGIALFSISWDKLAEQWELQEAPSLSDNDDEWTPVSPEGIHTEGNRKVFPVVEGHGKRFFRLKK